MASPVVSLTCTFGTLGNSKQLHVKFKVISLIMAQACRLGNVCWRICALDDD